jgi:signal transduction histidine kinase
VDDLLDVSRIVSGKMTLRKSAIDLEELISERVDAARTAAMPRGITFDTSVEPVSGHVTGDPDRLRQVLTNLLSNAVKFTPDGGRVSVSLAQRDESFVNLKVVDNGKGIHPDFLPYVFERFRQADATSSRTAGGLGIGLAIAREIVELHGGQISAFSEGEGKGATFSVDLPVNTH